MSEPTPAPAVKPAAAGPKRNVFLIAIVAVNMLGMVGLGAYLVLGQQGGHAAAQTEEGDEEGDDELDEEDGEEEGEAEVGPLIEFESMVVNLEAPTTDRYLKVTFSLELRGEENVEPVTARMVPYRDAVLMHLTSLTIEQVQGADNAALLRERLFEMARATFGRRSIRRVYLTEYLVQ